MRLETVRAAVDVVLAGSASTVSTVEPTQKTRFASESAPCFHGVRWLMPSWSANSAFRWTTSTSRLTGWNTSSTTNSTISEFKKSSADIKLNASPLKDGRVY